MGIPYFAPLLKIAKRKNPRCCRLIKLNDLRGKKLVIDTNQVLFRILVRTIKENGGPILHSIGGVDQDVGHLQVMIQKDRSLKLHHGIEPIYVFDGKPHPTKSLELERRSSFRKKIANKLEELQSDSEKKEPPSEEVAYCHSRLVSIGRSQTADCVQYLNYLGTPVIWAKCECDLQCAQLAHHPQVYGCLSDDSDLLAHGTPLLIRKLERGKYEEIQLQELIRGLGLDVTEDHLTSEELKELREETEKLSHQEAKSRIQEFLDDRSYRRFVDLCIVLRLLEKNSNYQHFLHLFQTQADWPELIRELGKFRKKTPPEELEKEVETLRAYYLGLDSEIISHTEVNLQNRCPQAHQLIRWICDEKGFGEGTREIICSLVTHYSTNTDRNFKSFHSYRRKRMLTLKRQFDRMMETEKTPDKCLLRETPGYRKGHHLGVRGR